ncbi:hypothetical protein CPC08DRAFT_763742 [Agrocybe pediades]|nr:hypothetical protein CPC08DRAFT_763742 [Agrocybe pediades]
MLLLKSALFTLAIAVCIVCSPIRDPPSDQIPALQTSTSKAGSNRAPHTRRWVFVNAVTTGGDWQIQGEIFRAWGSEQEFTVPLFALHNPTTTDFIYVTSDSVNTPPPVAAGFEAVGIAGFVYDTQVCGSCSAVHAFPGRRERSLVHHGR